MKQAVLTLTYGGFAFIVDSNHLPKSSVSVFLRAAVPEIEKMLNADATCMDVDPIDHDNQMREEGAKAERDRVLNIIQKYNRNDPIECPSNMKVGCDNFKGDCIDCVIQVEEQGKWNI